MSSQVEFIEKNVTFKNYLKKQDEISKLKKNILESVKDLISEKLLVKHNIELLLFVCKSIQNLINNKGKVEKVDKKALAIDILKAIFTSDFSKQDEEISSTLIQGLFDRGMIKRISRFKKVSISVIGALRRYSI